MTCLLLNMNQNQPLLRPLCGIPVCEISSLKFLSLHVGEGRDVRSHVGQLTVNFIVINKQALSLIQMVDLIRFTLDFKIAFSYKVNTML